ncbi:prephenate dehydratase [Croceibacter atlanticus]|jgi:prephenate dehydratase|uniref:prephenate dehydratase n=1 Tax=Croceibacter atlanticus TaxID=313588 RepID=UPI001C6036CF|nr:prephenate dehydratase [Croceibacter atlanticus]MBW4969305.1 prephenate dehydratase [Croceibacter atlanticus]
MTNTIAIQGIKGSFHHQVAQHYFGDTYQYDECLSFDTLVLSILNGKSDYAVMAIGNSIAGTILPNYSLIDAHNLNIIGESYINISMNVMALNGQTLSDINEVASHPIALLQCKAFFKDYPHIKLVEDNDTAEVAKRISEAQLKGIAAVASPIAANLYDLDILAKDIHTVKTNQTRFLILEANKTKRKDTINKASLKLVVGHQKGSLATALNVLSDCQLNLTKIQSIPIIDQPWSYAMFVDVTFENVENYDKAIEILEVMIEDVKILGEYKNKLEA